LCLKPLEFWGITPAELYALLQGYNWRIRQEFEREAIYACWIINRSGFASKAARPRDLVNFSDANKKIEGKTKESVKEMIDSAAKHLKQKQWTAFKDKYAKGEK
jgi:hypothetical protein